MVQFLHEESSCSDTDRHSYNIGKPISPTHDKTPPRSLKLQPPTRASSSSDNSIRTASPMTNPCSTQLNHPSALNPAKSAPHQYTEFSRLLLSNATHCSLKIFNPPTTTLRANLTPHHPPNQPYPPLISLAICTLTSHVHLTV
ncbi:hypothetical protein HNY73_003541 [Argiope bruennichi]|uniref:Uncharacterized protein n=1 Tax=Argiope bruennichi TaxID=94029 RepID=A0A8T0FT61_ARGBR|nr:hypothetical protein HNY73_003541 [Argiope bruennichi]